MQNQIKVTAHDPIFVNRTVLERVGGRVAAETFVSAQLAGCSGADHSRRHVGATDAAVHA
jgi:hypothetical protein